MLPERTFSPLIANTDQFLPVCVCFLSFFVVFCVQFRNEPSRISLHPTRVLDEYGRFSQPVRATAERHVSAELLRSLLSSLPGSFAWRLGENITWVSEKATIFLVLHFFC